MSNLVQNMSFSSLYGLVSSPLRPSTPTGSTQQTESTRPSSPEHELLRRESHETVTQKPLIRHSDSRRQLAVAAPVQEAELQLSAECPHCANDVVIKVPRYMMQAMSSGQARVEQNLYDSRQAWVEHEHVQIDSARDKVVAFAVAMATAFRESRVPALLLSFFQATIAMILYLDRTFSIHQRMIVVFWIVLADLQRIEAEVGLLRNSGDAISVLWEAFVKGAIALGRPGTESHPQAVPSSHLQQPQYVQNPRAPPPSAHSDSGYGSQQSFPFPPHSSVDSAQVGMSSSPPFRATTNSLPSNYLHPSHAVDDHHYSSAGESSSDHEYLEAAHKSTHAQPAPRRRTLRRMANSVPTFREEDGNSSARSGSLTPSAGPGDGTSTANSYFGDSAGGQQARPRLGRQRSRSGPEDTVDNGLKPPGEAYGWNGRGWVAQKVAGVVGRVI